MSSGSAGFAATFNMGISQPPTDAAVEALRPLTLHVDGRCLGTVQFEIRSSAELLPLAQQNVFASDLCREFSKLEAWATNQNWTVTPLPGLRVVVSDRFKISKSLVPAWSGRLGQMEFPIWRVLSRKAAILHELVHVFFPNGNRLLAEGLAIHLQAELGGNPAFPNFNRPLHELVRELWRKPLPDLSSGAAETLGLVRLAELDEIPTPNPLTLEIGDDLYGEEPRGQAHLYPLAGSFVQHLIQSRGLQAFWALYCRTPLLPLHQDAGSQERWIQVYGASLSELEAEWKGMLVG